jgi:hypothetical protein
VAPLAARFLRIDLPAALRTAAALYLHGVIGAWTYSHDDPLSSINRVGKNKYSSLIDSSHYDKGEGPFITTV